METIKIKIEIEISYEDIIGHLCNALEGGSNYWYYLPDLSMVNKHYDKEKDQPYLVNKIAKAVMEGNESIPVHDLEDREELLGVISRDNIQRGFELYSIMEKPLAADEADADDSDILFQLIVMGEIVFG